MSKWHYIYEDELIFPHKDDYRNGNYMVYQVDMYNKILSDKNWVHENDAFDEYEYLADCGYLTMQSTDGKLRYVPDSDILWRDELGREQWEYEMRHPEADEG